MTNVTRKMAAGVAWMSLMRVAIKALALVNTVVLARLLVPADFGVVAMAMSLIAAMELFKAFNFDVALIQRPDPDRSYYDTAWTFNVILGLVLALMLVVIAYPAAAFYSEPRVTVVIQVLALSVFVSGFENIGVIAFRKDLAFSKEFALRIAQKGCSTAVTLPLAFVLRDYWALVIGMVSGEVVGVLISYYAHPFRPRISFDARKELLSFSKWLLANNVLWFFRDRSPDYMLGRLAGANALGLFTISFEISNLPTSELIAPINRAVFPAYAKMAHDLETLRQGFLNVISFVVLLALPAGLGIAVTSELIVAVVLGDKWQAATPLISILAIFGALNALQTNCGMVHYALGRPKTVTIIGILQVACLLPTLIWGAYNYGAIGIAWAYLANIAFVMVPLQYGFVLHRLDLSFARLFSVLWRPVVGAVAMYAVTAAWISGPRGAEIGALASAIAIGVVSYVATIGALWLAAGRPDGAEKTVAAKLLVPGWKALVATAVRLRT